MTSCSPTPLALHLPTLVLGNPTFVLILVPLGCLPLDKRRTHIMMLHRMLHTVLHRPLLLTKVSTKRLRRLSCLHRHISRCCYPHQPHLHHRAGIKPPLSRPWTTLLPKETQVRIGFFILVPLVICLQQVTSYLLALLLRFPPLLLLMVHLFPYIVLVTLNFLLLLNDFFFEMLLLHPLLLKT